MKSSNRSPSNCRHADGARSGQPKLDESRSQSSGCDHRGKGRVMGVGAVAAAVELAGRYLRQWRQQLGRRVAAGGGDEVLIAGARYGGGRLTMVRISLTAFNLVSPVVGTDGK